MRRDFERRQLTQKQQLADQAQRRVLNNDLAQNLRIMGHWITRRAQRDAVDGERELEPAQRLIRVDALERLGALLLKSSEALRTFPADPDV